MRAYHFSEQPYPNAWAEQDGPLRVTLPNRHVDPKIAADLFHRYYDEWLLADELGLDIMINEHHSTATCMSAAAVVPLAILARQTKRARLLVLGYPIGHRPDPLRVAEELATIDVISRGRLDMGFVKGVPYEFPVSNQNPVGVMDRFWESHDFIIKAMTSHDEPFNWEGEHFHYRHVNLWPRPWQQPHPPVWSTTGSRTNAHVLGERGYVMAVLGTGYNTRPLYDAYRAGAIAAGRPMPGPDRLAYLGLLAVAETESEARRRGELVAGYMWSGGRVLAPFRNPPGYLSIADNVRMLRGEGRMRSLTKDGRAIDMRASTLQDLIDAGIMFCGTPNQAYQQMIDFIEHAGGCGHFLLMGQAGFLGHDDTADNLTHFAREILPRLKEYQQPVVDAIAAE